MPLKLVLKSFFNLLSLILVSPLILLEKLYSLFSSSEKLFQTYGQVLSLIPGLVGVYLRRAFYFLTIRHCSLDCYISFGTLLTHKETEIGRGVFLGDYCEVGKVRIGENTLIGSNVDIISGKYTHHFSNPAQPIHQQGGIFKQIQVGANSWIGNSAVILANLGEHCVVGAGSVVVEDIPSGSVAVGNPAKVIRQV
jgi:acetyltransferase-like isoleucine patch superfamily enzyme